MSTTKPVILVKKDEAKKGKLWHELANDRIFKQHGGYDIPEGDRHAVPKFESPVHYAEKSAEETKEMLSDLEKEIQRLKEKDTQSMKPSTPPEDFNEYLKNQSVNHSDRDDELR